jgi:branched-chain amino acid aminotransferase
MVPTMTLPEDLLGRQQATNGDEFSEGCAWVSGRYLPIDRAGMPLTDTGIARSDLTYDVAAVWEGRFFRLDDHIDRLLRGCARLRLTPPLSHEQIRDVLIECVRRTGLRESYVEAIVTRGLPPPGGRDPRRYKPQFYAYAVPYVWIFDPDQQTVGIDLVVARDTIRIPTGSVDPTVKNFHWGDLTRGLFESFDRGAMSAVLPDGNGNVTEGPGFNLFAVLEGALATPARGVLEGITRRTVLEIAQEFGIPTQVTDIPVDALYRATEIFLTSTAGGIMPVHALDGDPVGDGRPGEITTRIRDQYWALHEDQRYTTMIDYPVTAAASYTG